ncbi:hypothetical protein LC040_09660 [Bacillus tianshenii]|nr:hypothetical protein LC040_09660 [Bacillus tianshenii]
MNKSFYFIFGTGCGWLSLQVFSEISVENWTVFIFRPIYFLMGMTCFTFSFLCLAVFVCEFLYEGILFIHGEGRGLELLSSLSFVVSFIILFYFYGIESAALLIFTLSYGIISLDFNRLKQVRKRKQ